MGLYVEPPGPDVASGLVASQHAFNQTTAPGAGAVLAVINNPPAGLYQVTAYCEISGTITAAEQDNILIQVDNNTFSHIPIQAIPTSGLVQEPFQCTVLSNGTNIRLEAVGAGGVAAVYTTVLIANKVA
jgi:hypothetical protein